MVIFVTNATGFVGSHLCRQLQEHNHEVIALVRNYKKFEKTGLCIKTVVGDLSPESVAGWMQELPPKIDAIIHNAGQVHAHRIKEFFQTNTQGTRNLVQELRKRYEKLHFLFISSVAAMGPSTETPLVETDPRMPVSCYGLSKKLAEEILDKYSPSQWTLTILTPAIVIGPGDPAMVDIFRMVYNRLFIGFGLNFRKKAYSFVSIFDLINATEKALFRGGNRKEVYFIAHPDACTSVTLIRTLEKIMRLRAVKIPIPFAFLVFISVLIRFFPSDLRLTRDKLHDFYPSLWIFNGGKLSKDFGLNYEWDIKKTLEITYRDYLHRNLL